MSERVRRLKPSPTISLFNKAKELESSGKEIIHFEVGEPDMATPQYIMDAAIEAMKQGHTHYTPSAGIPALRAKISEKYPGNYTSNNVLITTGAKFALYLVIQALIDPGDEVLAHAPIWPSYASMVELAGGVMKYIPSKDISNVEDYISPSTKLIILNTPCNPTGTRFNREELKIISQTANEQDLFVLNDEIYSYLSYGSPYEYISHLPGMKERTIIIDGFSKTYAMTGWRVGHIIAPENIIKDCNKLQQSSVTCATSFVQHACVKALETDRDIAALKHTFLKRRDLMYSLLTEMGLDFPCPDGAFYLFPDFSQFEPDSIKLSEALLSAGVAATPGIAFGQEGEGHLRFSYANDEESIKKGMAIVEKVISSL